MASCFRTVLSNHETKIMMNSVKFFFRVSGAMLLTAAALWAADVGPLQRTFDEPPADARIMVRWWWFGPAVTKPELERELRVM